MSDQTTTDSTVDSNVDSNAADSTAADSNAADSNAVDTTVDNTPDDEQSTTTAAPIEGEGRLSDGDLVLLVDQKSRRYLVRLKVGGEFGTHSGVVPHDSIIGQSEGGAVSSTKGQKFRAYRPSLSDYILSMKRGAQVIYPKDIGPILMLADIEPGCRVFESGVGSGALSMAMLRSGAHITGYEIREDFASRARKNVAEFLGEQALEHYDVHLRSSYEPLEHGPFDRVVLDLPEPWEVVPHLGGRLRPGGIFVSYSPSITQVMKVRDALTLAGFDELSTTEVLNRTWHIEGAAVRPDHRMVAHTGFLTRARLLAG